jgi:YceI-like domain
MKVLLIKKNKMRKIIILSILFGFFSGNAQKMLTKTGVITFDGSVPNFEPVRAKNEAVTCVFKPENGQIACLALIKAFRFKTALMEEHFNENYLESTKFPKAILKGKIDDFNAKDLTDKPKIYNLTGNIELHGIKKNVIIKISVSKTNNGINIVSDFVLNASDFDIAIPSFVKSKLTDKIKVNVNFLLTESSN